MAEAMDAREQRNLPFPEGEASHAERWNDLMIALSRIGRRCDLVLKDFVQWVFRATDGGRRGTLQKSYARLAERPSGLCCSAGKVRSTVELAERLGLIRVERIRRLDGAQLDNAYSIDWAGVRRIVLGRSAGVTTEHPPATTAQGPATTAQALATWRHQLKDIEGSAEGSAERNSGTGPEPMPRGGTGPNSRMDSEKAAGDLSLSAVLCRQSPILTAAGKRRIAPLAATETMLHGVYAPLKRRHLHKPLQLVRWFRLQLSTIRPVMGDTEADLLLTLATALYATSLPEQEVAKNRVAVFVGTMSRRRWTRALPFVPQARALLDEGIAGRGAAWAGLADEPVEVAEKAGAAP